MCTATPFTLICPIIVFCTTLVPPSTSLIPQPAGNLTIRWPTDLTIEVVASSSISDLNSIVHLLHDDITRANTQSNIPIFKHHLHTSLRQQAIAENLSARLKTALELRANTPLLPLLYPTTQSLHPSRSKRNILASVFGVATSADIRSVRRHLDIEHRAAELRKDELHTLRKQLKHQIAEFSASIKAAGGVVANHTHVHAVLAAMSILSAHNQYVTDQLDRMTAIVETIETGRVHSRFLENAHLQSGELLQISAGKKQGEFELHMLITTYKIRLIPLVLTTNNECCVVQDSAEDVGALTAVKCTDLVRIPYYANFFASKPSGCVAHLHPALATPSGTDTCVLLNGYNRAIRCVSLSRGRILGVKLPRPEQPIHIREIRPRPYSRKDDEQANSITVTPPRILFLDEDSQPKYPTWTKVPNQPSSIDPSYNSTLLWTTCIMTISALLTALVAAIISIYTTHSLRSAKESISQLHSELERLSGRAGTTDGDIELTNQTPRSQ